MDERAFNVAFTAALETVLGDDFETPALYRRYDQYFEVAVEPLDKAAQAWALRKCKRRFSDGEISQYIDFTSGARNR
jgi:hypothetical protein